jgi:hypothetical protein
MATIKDRTFEGSTPASVRFTLVSVRRMLGSLRQIRQRGIKVIDPDLPECSELAKVHPRKAATQERGYRTPKKAEFQNLKQSAPTTE